MSHCLSHINLTLHYINLALYHFNHEPTLKCYPGFSHNEMSDILLHARKLLFDYHENEHIWLNYKHGNIVS